MIDNNTQFFKAQPEKNNISRRNPRAGLSCFKGKRI